MTADILPSIIATPFSRHFDDSTGIFHGSGSTYSRPSEVHSPTLSPLFIHQDASQSAASFISIVSPSVTANDENLQPVTPVVLPPVASRAFSSQLSPSIRTGQARRSMSCGQHPAHVAQYKRSAVNVRTDPDQDRMEHRQNQEPRANTLHKRIGPIFVGHLASEFPSLKKSLRTVPKVLVNASNLDIFGQSPLGDYRSIQSHVTHVSTSSTLSEQLGDTCLAEHQFRRHKKRRSTASSGFVHTVKTASLSNASFSLVPRSLRLGRSTDSTGFSGALGRPSIESDRPPTTSSVDDAVFRRGLKRRQIIEELIKTEESYVADLKALLYLYSTLLATATSIPNRLRSSIQRNVHDLLHLHETLLTRLHQETYEAAARKWADTSSPRHLGSPRRHGRWRSLESKVAMEFGRTHRQIRSSTDSADLFHGKLYRGCAEPKDAANVATILKFFEFEISIYEEYCANHGLMAHELQKHAPAHWSTYEMGIESLAKALIALDHRQSDDKKGLTVGDLLIKPIQRLTKYPLILGDLLRHTTVADCPSSHAEIESTLQGLQENIQNVNLAANNHDTRVEMQRRWALQARLNHNKETLDSEIFRSLGPVRLCGVLHMAWQTKVRVDGSYCLCILFDSSFMVALPAGCGARFDIVALLRLSNITVESASDGRGLQCHTTLYTWKICFEINGQLHEFILSACSATEEAAWKDGLLGKLAPFKSTENKCTEFSSTTKLDLRSVGMVYGQQTTPLARKPSVQRAATVGNRAPVVQLIVRNTHNAQDLGEYRQASTSSINRSQSHMTSNRIVVLSPKRSERARLESSLADVWTRERIPYPGMIGSRGGQIIRASAGSLVRKLSLASIHAPFSRRSGSISMASRKSYDTSSECQRSKIKASLPVFEVRKESLDEGTPGKAKSHDVPEVDTMENLVSRMIGSGSRRHAQLGTGDHVSTENLKQKSMTSIDHKMTIGPEDPADVYYAEDKAVVETGIVMEAGLGGKRKRWSNPIGILKGLSTEGLRHMLYSSK